MNPCNVTGHGYGCKCFIEKTPPTRLQEIEQRLHPGKWSGVHECTQEDVEYLFAEARHAERMRMALSDIVKYSQPPFSHNPKFFNEILLLAQTALSQEETPKEEKS